MAVDSDESFIGNSEVKDLEERVRELERILERTTLENEILREALSRAHTRKLISLPISLPEDGSVADVQDVSLSKFAERLKGKSKPRAP